MEINLAVLVGAALGRRHRVDHPIKRWRQLGQILRPRDVGDKRFQSTRHQLGLACAAPTQAEHFMALTNQFDPQRQADVTAADNQHAHREILTVHCPGRH